MLPLPMDSCRTPFQLSADEATARCGSDWAALDSVPAALMDLDLNLVEFQTGFSSLGPGMSGSVLDLPDLLNQSKLRLAFLYHQEKLLTLQFQPEDVHLDNLAEVCGIRSWALRWA